MKDRVAANHLKAARSVQQNETHSIFSIQLILNKLIKLDIGLPVASCGAGFGARRPPTPRRVENGIETQQDAHVRLLLVLRRRRRRRRRGRGRGRGRRLLVETLPLRRQDDVEGPSAALAAALATRPLLFEDVMLGASLQRLGVRRRDADALPLAILTALFIAPE